MTRTTKKQTNKKTTKKTKNKIQKKTKQYQKKREAELASIENARGKGSGSEYVVHVWVKRSTLVHGVFEFVESAPSD